MIFFRYLNRVLLFVFLLNLCFPVDVVAKYSNSKSKDSYNSEEYKGKKKQKDDKYCDCERGAKHYKYDCKFTLPDKTDIFKDELQNIGYYTVGLL